MAVMLLSVQASDMHAAGLSRAIDQRFRKFSCAPSNLTRGGSFTVLDLSCETEARCDTLCSDYGTGRRSAKRLAGSAGCFGAGHADVYAMNEPASAPVSLTDAASRRILLFGR